MEFKRKSKKMKKRLEEKTTMPFRGAGYRKEQVIVKSFQGRNGFSDGPLKPYIEVEGSDSEWLTESEARRLAKCIISHADRIKRYKENERKKHKPRAHKP